MQGGSDGGRPTTIEVGQFRQLRHFVYYNFCRIHQALRVTPAMAAGLSKTVWEIEDLAALVEAQELQAIENGEMKRGKYKAKSSD